jgi:hypothetical protein
VQVTEEHQVSVTLCLAGNLAALALSPTDLPAVPRTWLWLLAAVLWASAAVAVSTRTRRSGLGATVSRSLRRAADAAVTLSAVGLAWLAVHNLGEPLAAAAVLVACSLLLWHQLRGRADGQIA